MVFDKIRFFSGLTIVCLLLIFFIFKLNYALIFLIIIFINYDLIISKIYSFKLLLFYNFLLILFIILYHNLNISSIYIGFLFFIFLILSIFLIRNKFILIILIYLFIMILFNLNYLDINLIYFLILISFCNDTIAYIAGRYLRGPLIVPSISPNKTWSGTIFSFFFSLILIYLFDFSFLESAIISISLFFGDLYFSFIKRSFKIKDFSNLIPGHGGLLDRLDSVFISSALVFLFKSL